MKDKIEFEKYLAETLKKRDQKKEPHKTDAQKIISGDVITDTHMIKSADEDGCVKVSSNFTSDVGFFNKREINKLKGKKDIESARIIFKTQLENLQHKADAATRESKAFWDAKSVEVSRAIKQYAQVVLAELEHQKVKNKKDVIEKTFILLDESLKKTYSSDLSEPIKQKLIERTMHIFEEAIKRIEDDTIAKKYDLTWYKRADEKLENAKILDLHSILINIQSQFRLIEDTQIRIEEVWKSFIRENLKKMLIESHIRTLRKSLYDTSKIEDVV